MRERNEWTPEELKLLEEMYSRTDIFVSDIAAKVNHNLHQVYNKAAALGLKRPHEIRVISGRIGAKYEAAIVHQFKKGTVPPNKGKKMPPEIYDKLRPTMFKKGNITANHRDVGSERVNVEGYVEVKVAEPNKWRLKHRIVWEQAYGEIPAGYNVQFKNGNRQDLRLDNLYIISRQEQLRTQNSYLAKYPKELQEVIRLKGALKRQIRKKNER